MGFLSGGGKMDDGGLAAQQAEALRKQQAETDRLKKEQADAQAAEDERRRQVAAGLIGRRSLFTNDETGYSRTLGASS